MDRQYYTTKIIGGRLVTCPAHHLYNFQTPNQISTESKYHAGLTARYEAQQNKERALAQTYRSVLSPEPRSYFSKNEVKKRPATHPLPSDICQKLQRLSRHTLLTALSALRRLDPDEDGILPNTEITNTMLLYNIRLPQEDMNALFFHFKKSNFETHYNALWEFLMDCFAQRSNLDVPTSTQLFQYQQSEAKVQHGLQARLQFEMRQYARKNQRPIDLSALKKFFLELDRYGTGRILCKQALHMCSEELHEIDISLLNDIIRSFDTNANGLINYHDFIEFLQSCRGTYLPPLNMSQRFSPTQLHNDYENANNKSQILNGIKDNMNVMESSNSQLLRDIGELEMHLSDFETKVVSQKAQTKDQSLIKTNAFSNVARSSSADTYTLDSPRLLIQEQREVLKSPMKLVKRKQWQDAVERNTVRVSPVTPSKQLDERDKWWKKDITYEEQLERKNWKSSGKIKTVKSRRRKRKFKEKKVESLSSGSDVYTTTDVEVEDNDGKFTIEEDADDNLDKNLKDFREILNKLSVNASDNISSEGRNNEQLQLNKFQQLDCEIDSNTINDFDQPKINNQEEKCDTISDNPIPSDSILNKSKEVVSEVLKEVATENIGDSCEPESLPNQNLRLDWIYGHRKVLEVISKDVLIYPVGCVFVIHNMKTNTQTYFQQHTSTILRFCLLLSEEEKLVASTEEEQLKIKIITWDANHLAVNTSSCITLDCHHEIVDMKWIEKNLLILLKSEKKNESLYLFDPLHSTIIQKCQVKHAVGICVASTFFCIYGKSGVISFYDYPKLTFVGEGNYGDMKKGKQLNAAVYDEKANFMITGDSSGSLLVWRECRIHHAITNAHVTSVVSMCFIRRNYLITCSKDGTVVALNENRNACTSRLNIAEKYGSICHMKYDNYTLFVITNSCVLSIDVDDGADPLKNALSNISVVVECPTDANTSIYSHESYDNFVACLSSDGQVVMLNTENKSIVWNYYVKGNGSCLACSRNSDHALVGCQDGSLHVLDSMNGVLIEKHKYRYNKPTGVKFSTNDCYVAIGYEDGCLQVFQWDNGDLEYFAEAAITEKCIVSIEWSPDDKYILMLTEGDNQMICYDLCAQRIESNICTSNQLLQDFSLRKEFQKESDIKDIIVAARQKKSDLIALATKDFIYLIKYPVSKKIPYQFVRHNHGKFIKMMFSCDGTTLISASRTSPCIFQWKLFP